MTMSAAIFIVNSCIATYADDIHTDLKIKYVYKNIIR